MGLTKKLKLIGKNSKGMFPCCNTHPLLKGNINKTFLPKGKGAFTECECCELGTHYTARVAGSIPSSGQMNDGTVTINIAVPNGSTASIEFITRLLLQKVSVDVSSITATGDVGTLSLPSTPYQLSQLHLQKEGSFLLDSSVNGVFQAVLTITTTCGTYVLEVDYTVS